MVADRIDLVIRIRTGLVIWVTGNLLLVTFSCCAVLESVGGVRSRLQWLYLWLRLSILLSGAVQEAIWMRKLTSELSSGDGPTCDV